MMSSNPIKSLANYSRFVAEVMDHPIVRCSTLAVWSDSPFTGTAEGEVWFSDGIRLRIREELDFDAGLITAYGMKYIGVTSGCIGMTIIPIRAI